MKKKILIFLAVLGMSLFGLFSFDVYANSEFPQSARRLVYFGHEFVQESGNTYEYIVKYYLGHTVFDEDLTYFLVSELPIAFVRGRIDRRTNSYNLEYKRLESGYSEFHFRFTISKSIVDDEYSGNVRDFFLVNSRMYIGYDYIEPTRLMSHILTAEPLVGDGVEVQIGIDNYYMYVDAQVYLPNGYRVPFSLLPDYFDTNLKDFDFVVVMFNLTPRVKFWSPVFPEGGYVSGLSYVIYNKVENYTVVYNYAGVRVHYANELIYFETPRFYYPEGEIDEYQNRLAYEQGKTEGINIGKELGYEEAMRYIEEEVRKAYNRGKNEAVMEQLDLFGYLQALFGEQGLGRLLKLELLPGVSLGAVIMIPLALWLVSFIMRWFR